MLPNKTIVFTEPYKLELQDLEIPPLKENEVLVKIARTAISSGTERANFIGDPNVSILAGPVAIYPRIVGYSSSGVVEAVGEAVTSVKPGDRVACSWSKHAQYCVVRESRVYKLPDNISFDAGALVHIATFSSAAIRKCRLEFGEPAMVMGLGILGLLAVALLKSAGAAPIIAVDPVSEKREQALRLGADYAISPFDPDFSERVKEITGGGVSVAIEVTGKGAGLDSALDCMKKFGRIALLGCTRSSDFTIDYYRKVHGPGITLIGAHTMARPDANSSSGMWTESDDAKAILRLASMGRIDLDQFVEKIYSPSDAQEVFMRLANEPSFPIVEFDWSKFK